MLRRTLCVHLQLMAAGETSEKDEELAFLGFVEPVPAAVLNNIKNAAGFPRGKLAVIDVMGHGGLLRSRWRRNTPGSPLFPAFRLSGHHAGAGLAGNPHCTIIPIMGRAAEGLAAITRAGGGIA
jgi:hypothetical protein